MEVFNIIAEGWAAFVAELFVEGGANLGWEPVSRLRRVRPLVRASPSKCVSIFAVTSLPRAALAVWIDLISPAYV